MNETLKMNIRQQLDYIDTLIEVEFIGCELAGIPENYAEWSDFATVLKKQVLIPEQAK